MSRRKPTAAPAPAKRDPFAALSDVALRRFVRETTEPSLNEAAAAELARRNPNWSALRAPTLTVRVAHSAYSEHGTPRPRIEIDSSPGGSWRAHQALVHRIAALVLEASDEALRGRKDGWNVEIDHGRTSFDSTVSLSLYDGSDAEALLGAKVIDAVVAKYRKGLQVAVKPGQACGLPSDQCRLVGCSEHGGGK